MLGECDDTSMCSSPNVPCLLKHRERTKPGTNTLVEYSCTLWLNTQVEHQNKLRINYVSKVGYNFWRFGQHVLKLSECLCFFKICYISKFHSQTLTKLHFTCQSTGKKMWISDFLSKNQKSLNSTYIERQQLVGMCSTLNRVKQVEIRLFMMLFVPNNSLEIIIRDGCLLLQNQRARGTAHSNNSAHSI